MKFYTVLYLDIIREIDYIINSNHQNKNLEWYRQNYINALKIKGLATINGSLKVENLINEFNTENTQFNVK